MLRGHLLAEVISGPANAKRNLTGSIEAVLEVNEKVITKANNKGLSLDQIHAGIDLAGINIPQIKQAILKQSLAFASCYPGFVDFQVNGGGGVLFNNQPT